MSGFDKSRLARLRDVMVRHVERDNAGGVAWLAARDGDVEVGVAGTLTREDGTAVEPDSLFRISSMTKPITAVAAMILVEECRLRLDDPIDDLLPEMANRRVLVDGRGGLDGETVPATRPITVDDVRAVAVARHGCDGRARPRQRATASASATRARRMDPSALVVATPLPAR